MKNGMSGVNTLPNYLTKWRWCCCTLSYPYFCSIVVAHPKPLTQLLQEESLKVRQFSYQKIGTSGAQASLHKQGGSNPSGVVNGTIFWQGQEGSGQEKSTLNAGGIIVLCSSSPLLWNHRGGRVAKKGQKVEFSLQHLFSPLLLMLIFLI